MDIEILEKRLETWKRILFVALGASVTLLATSIAELPNLSKPHFPGWYGVWFLVQLATLLPGFVLLWGRRWMRLPLPARLNTIFGFFVVTWIALLSVGVRMGSIATGSFDAVLFGCALVAALGYWWLRRKYVDPRGEVFP